MTVHHLFSITIGCPLDFSIAAGTAMNRYGVTFPHPASVYLAAAHNHPAMALAAMANTASIISGTTSGSSTENLFANSPVVNSSFSHPPGVNHLFPQNVTTVSTTEACDARKERTPGSVNISSINLQQTSTNNKMQENTSSALKAALQVKNQSLFISEQKQSTKL